MGIRSLQPHTSARIAGCLFSILIALGGCDSPTTGVTGESTGVSGRIASEEPGSSAGDIHGVSAQSDAQPPVAPGVPPGSGADSAQAPAAPAPQFTQERLEQLVAPVALYPDPLLMDVLMAATYPAEVAEAAAWHREHPKLNGKALDDAIADKNWDVSVNSLTHATQAIELMGADPQWTSDLGEAFLAQQDDVLNAVQVMRSRACDLGNLKTTDQQRVEIEQAPPPPPAQPSVHYVVAPPPRIVRIVPVQPEVLFVPVYNPRVIFGPPPPVIFYPRVYVYPGIAVGIAPVITFGVGITFGGLFWGDLDWHHHHVYRRHYDGGYYSGNYGYDDYWRHDVRHRRGVAYGQPYLEREYGVANREHWSREGSRYGNRNRADVRGGVAVDGQRGGGGKGNHGAAVEKGNRGGGGGKGNRGGAVEKGNRGGGGGKGNRAGNRGAVEKGNRGGGKGNRGGAGKQQGKAGQHGGGSSKGGGAMRGGGHGGGGPGAAMHGGGGHGPGGGGMHGGGHGGGGPHGGGPRGGGGQHGPGGGHGGGGGQHGPGGGGHGGGGGKHGH